MKTGLVSVTFRKLSPREIVDLVARTSLRGIEWGGDIHVPHGEIGTAGMVRRMTVESGLEVSSYGSYYRAVESEKEGLSFGDVLDSAVELGAPLVRVWSGKKGSAVADDTYRSSVVEDLARIGDLALAAGVMVCCEHHSNTLTDTDESAALLMREVANANVRLYWQPLGNTTIDTQLKGLSNNIGFIENMHAYVWKTTDGKREQLPFKEGLAEWRSYLDVADADGRDRWILLEFVKNACPEQFVADAAALNTLVVGGTV